MQDNGAFNLQRDENFTLDYQGTEKRGRSRLQVLCFSFLVSLFSLCSRKILSSTCGHEENRKVSGEFYRVARYFVYFRKEFGVFFALFFPGF